MMLGAQKMVGAPTRDSISFLCGGWRPFLIGSSRLRSFTTSNTPVTWVSHFSVVFGWDFHAGQVCAFLKFIEFTKNLQDIFLNKIEKFNPQIFLNPPEFSRPQNYFNIKNFLALQILNLKNKDKRSFQPSKFFNPSQILTLNCFQLGEVPVWGSASWGSCQLGEVPVGGGASWGSASLETSASWGTSANWGAEFNLWTDDFFPIS